MRAINDASMAPHLVPLVESGIANAVLAAQVGNWTAGFGMLKDGNDLTVSKAGRLHVVLSGS
jgi:hypothetical protein